MGSSEPTGTGDYLRPLYACYLGLDGMVPEWGRGSTLKAMVGRLTALALRVLLSLGILITTGRCLDARNCKF